MEKTNNFEVIIVGGSYAGLSAAMVLGRSLRKVLVIDSGLPCNRQTPHSHNFITHDGDTPAEIARQAKAQVEKYTSVSFYSGLAMKGKKTESGFELTTLDGHVFTATKLIFATGIKDIMPDIPGFAESWGISVLHCPYCHGYEVKDEKTGVLGNGEYGYDFSMMISHWTHDLTLFTNGPATLTYDQMQKLKEHGITVVEKKVKEIKHNDGKIRALGFTDETEEPLVALYTRCEFEQHSSIPQELGCEISPEGYIQVDMMQKTSAPGVYACGDNTSRMRTVSTAVAAGTMAGAAVNRELIMEQF